MSLCPEIKLGDIWYRAYGELACDLFSTSSDIVVVMRKFVCVKVTEKGAWFKHKEMVDYDWCKPVFSLRCGARNLHRTEEQALQSLIARKRRQLQILRSQMDMADEVLATAKAELKRRFGK